MATLFQNSGLPAINCTECKVQNGDMSTVNNQTPRRKRMQRQRRLQADRHWIPTYTGRNIIKGYKNWFGVDLLCVIQELKALGIKLDDQYIRQALKNNEHKSVMRQKKREETKKRETDALQFDLDGNFYYIAGYTSGDFPYGITWEEAAELENQV